MSLIDVPGADEYFPEDCYTEQTPQPPKLTAEEALGHGLYDPQAVDPDDLGLLALLDEVDDIFADTTNKVPAPPWIKQVLRSGDLEAFRPIAERICPVIFTAEEVAMARHNEVLERQLQQKAADLKAETQRDRRAAFLIRFYALSYGVPLIASAQKIDSTKEDLPTDYYY